MMQRRHAAPIVLGALALAVAVVLGLALRPRPVPVETALVSGGPMRVWIDAEGKARVRDRYIVTAPIAGRVGRSAFREGDEVTAGSLIARIDPLGAQTAIAEANAKIAEALAQRSGVATLVPKPQAIEQARGQIAVAESAKAIADERTVQANAALEQAEREQARARTLEASGYLPRRDREAAELAATMRRHDLDAARLAARSAQSEVTRSRAALAELEAKRNDATYLYGVYEAQIAGARATVRRLRDEAARTQIRAPVSGHVLRVLQQSEAEVSAGTPILEIGNTGSLEMVFDVLSSDAAAIAPGAEVRVVGGDGAQNLSGRVRRIEPSAFTKVSALGVEEQRVNVIADFLGARPRIGDLYRLEAQISLWSAADVTQIPIAALFRCNVDWCAYAVVDGAARWRTVALGHRNDLTAEVRSGVRRGERVVLQFDEQLRDGARVVVRAP